MMEKNKGENNKDIPRGIAPENYSDKSGDIVYSFDHPNDKENEEIIPHNQSCNVSEIIDESGRIDDNRGLSPTAETGLENCIYDPMVPGVGVTDKEGMQKETEGNNQETTN